ncbi:hypothetical protein TWF481_002461 [Arthrobotrys musiformis]|uniref:Uncharacterized protein n=1 Tax=Arthrobotrys musiformis TaxID=47236 RepID=A0AAV9VUW0_9PEZI
MPPASASPTLTLPNLASWTLWLTQNAIKPSAAGGVWLTLAKKGTTTPTSLSYSDALDEALCHGWIDGQRKSLDSLTFSQRFTPRAKKSVWSKRNVEIISRLEGDGRMKASGIDAVNAAKADGRWDAAYAGPATAVITDPEFLKALEGSEGAKRAFEGLNSQNRFAIYIRLLGVKTEEGRKRKVKEIVEMLEGGETYHPQKSAGKKKARTAKDEDGEEGKGKKAKRAASESGDETAPSVQKRKKKEKTEASKVVEVAPPRRQGLRQRKEKP